MNKIKSISKILSILLIGAIGVQTASNKCKSKPRETIT